MPTTIEGTAGLERWFAALRAAGQGTRPVRALHYGDSTIAADGLTRTVRARLAERFGDGGPGFVTAAFHPGTNVRSDILFDRRGGWSIRSILRGGGGGRYGLGGVVSVVTDGAYVTLGAVDAAKAPRPQQRFEVWYQAGVGYGTFVAQVDGREVARTPAVAAETEDRRFTLDVPEGYTQVVVRAEGGPVPVYGIVLERPTGITWESLGVIGVGSKSFTTFAREHLGVQMRERAPDLVVVQLGGNEVGYPSVTDGTGKAYAPIFSAALDTILAGAGGASCLVVTPLDQGELDEVDGLPRSKPGMRNLVARQREVARARGCAFWDARAAMGGEGSAATWGTTAGIGTGDFVHVSGRGLEILGNLLADALLDAYRGWEARSAGAAP